MLWRYPNNIHSTIYTNFFKSCSNFFTFLKFVWSREIGCTKWNCVLWNKSSEVTLQVQGFNLFHSWMTLGMKRILELFRFARNRTKQINMSTRTSHWWSLVVLNHKCSMAHQLKKLYRVNTIFSSIFFDKIIPVLTPGWIFHKRSL